MPPVEIAGGIIKTVHPYYPQYTYTPPPSPSLFWSIYGLPPPLSHLFMVEIQFLSNLHHYQPCYGQFMVIWVLSAQVFFTPVMHNIDLIRIRSVLVNTIYVGGSKTTISTTLQCCTIRGWSIHFPSSPNRIPSEKYHLKPNPMNQMWTSQSKSICLIHLLQILQ